MDQIWIGIDLGTQSVRAVAVDSAGVQCGAHSVPLHDKREGVIHEQDPTEWKTAVRECLRAVANSLDQQQKSAIGGIAVDGTSGTFTMIGPAGEPVLPGIMYDDGRAAGYAERVTAEGSALWIKLGYRAQPSWALTKLVQLTAESPELLRGNRLAHQPDVITSMLAGHPVAADSSHAMKTGFDIVDLEWPAALLDALDIPREVLPRVVTPGTTLGSLCAAKATETGLPQGIPLFAGMTDGCAGQLSSGALVPGDWNSVLGTTLVLKGVSTTLRGDPTGTVYSHRGPEPGTWLPGGASGIGAGIVTDLFSDVDLDAASALAVRSTPPIGYPLNRAGERFPFVASDARGFVIHPDTGEVLGWDAATVRALGTEVALSAVLHGVAFTERLCFDVLNEAGLDISGRIRTGGGATKNRWWNQLRADVLGRSIELARNTEAGVGMAVLAAWASEDHGRSLAEVAAAMVHVDTTYEPSGTSHADSYAAFRGALTERGWIS